MDRKKYNRINNAFLSGELILGIKYRYNSQVKVFYEEGKRVTGWIVGVDKTGPEPIYTIEILGEDPN